MQTPKEKKTLEFVSRIIYFFSHLNIYKLCIYIHHEIHFTLNMLYMFTLTSRIFQQRMQTKVFNLSIALFTFLQECYNIEQRTKERFYLDYIALFGVILHYMVNVDKGHPVY